jgi:hypothetical protein
MRGWDRQAIERAAALPAGEFDRFMGARRIYLETSAFNSVFDAIAIPELERMRERERERGTIFVASPMLFWEIMLSGDADRGDAMLMGAQALFDPLLLASPSDLAARYLRAGYPENRINYSFFAGAEWLERWRAITGDYSRNFTFQGHLEKARTFRVVSKNLRSIVENEDHPDEMVRVATEYVTKIFWAIGDDLKRLPIDDVTAKLVILYVFLLLLLPADLEHSEARALWIEKGFTGERENEQITAAFRDFPEIFRCGPILEMANMAALQYAAGKPNRGVLHDGMHMAYAPYVEIIVSCDAVFLELGAKHDFYREKVRPLPPSFFGGG